MTSPEIPLSGGWVNEGVVRVGDTMRRTVDQHSAFVRELLEHLEQVGFDSAPRFVGIDDRGREILTLLPGSPVEGTEILTDDQIVSATALLRGYHDAAATFPRLRAETIVHGDPGLRNVLWQGDRALALIDFDEARPGKRLEDVGYFVWKGLRLVPERPSLDEQARRLTVLTDGYGLAVDDELLTAIEAAVAWLHAKGTREAWPWKSREQLESEASWLRDAVDGLR